MSTLHWVIWSGFYYTAHLGRVSNAFFFYFYIAFIVSISHFCPCLYYICTVQKVDINYRVQNKSKWAETSYFYVLCCHVFICSCFIGNCNSSIQINISHKKGKKYLDLFVWDRTIAMSEGKMETAMMLLPVHRTTHLTFSKGVCHFSQ